MTSSPSPAGNSGDDLGRWGRAGFWVAVPCLAAGIAGAALDREAFARSYLLAFLFWNGMTLGCLAVLMLHHLVGGRWGGVIRRILEAGARTLPLMVLLSLPLWIGLLSGHHHLFPWAGDAESAGGDAGLEHKRAYLNVPFFLVRTVLYFAVWYVLASLLTQWSFEQDRTGSPAYQRRLQLLSGPGLIAYGVTVTFASIDWVMSLEPHWYSTIYGVLFLVGQALAGLALGVVVLHRLARWEPLSRIVRPEHYHDLGNLLLAFVMLWAYIAFSQYLIIWSGNLPEEIPWYRRRSQGGWEWLAVALILFHFAVPFLLLLSRTVKRRAGTLACVAGGLLVLRWADLLWLEMPAVRDGGFSVHWLDLVLPAGVGGLWCGVFARILATRDLLPREVSGLLAGTPEGGGNPAPTDDGGLPA